MEIVRFLLSVDPEGDAKQASVRSALVGRPPDRCLLGGREAVRFPLPAILFMTIYKVDDLQQPRARWLPGDSILVVTEGPIVAVAVICRLLEGASPRR